MIKLLAKIFIKNNNEFNNPQVRRHYGILCGAVGIVLNIFLFCGKLFAGFIAKSVAITADAFNNLVGHFRNLLSLFALETVVHKPLAYELL